MLEAVGWLVFIIGGLCLLRWGLDRFDEWEVQGPATPTPDIEALAVEYEVQAALDRLEWAAYVAETELEQVWEQSALDPLDACEPYDDGWCASPHIPITHDPFM